MSEGCVLCGAETFAVTTEIVRTCEAHTVDDPPEYAVLFRERGERLAQALEMWFDMHYLSIGEFQEKWGEPVGATVRTITEEFAKRGEAALRAWRESDA